MKNIPKNKIVEDWLEEHGDPEIDKKVEKQLELEEAAEKYARKQCDDMYDNESLTGASWGWETSLDFIAGAKWQAERMYSEEEVRELLLMQRGNSYVAILTKTKDVELAAIASTAPEPGGKDGWVKQNKKK